MIDVKKIVGKMINHKQMPIITVMLVSAIGVLSLLYADAATFSISIESEAGTESGSASEIPDASASNGFATRFGQASTPGTNPPIRTGQRCNLYLQQAGPWSGEPDNFWTSHNLLFVVPEKPPGEPRGFWKYDGPHDFQYDPQTGEQDYLSLRNYIANVLSNKNCGPTMIAGGSNGAAFAAKLYCRGEDFGGRVWAFSIDDPVMDDGVRGCNPSRNILKALFTHSQELADKSNTMPDFRCSRIPDSWYCENDKTMPLAEYESIIGQKSIHQRRWHSNNNDFSLPGYGFWDWGGLQAKWWCEWYRQYMPSVLPIPICQ